MKNKIQKKILKTAAVPILIFVLLFASMTISATESCKMTATEIKEPQIDWPTAPIGGYNLDGNSTIPDLVAYFFGWGVGLGGLAVFIALIIAGVQYITSVADPKKVNEAKDRIKSAVIGLGLLLSSWAIFQLINPNLNTLQDLPDVTSTILDGGMAMGTICTIEGPNAWECCKIHGCDPETSCTHLSNGADNPNCCVNPSCAPENFVCCKKNDSDCVAQKNKTVISANSSTKKASGATCTDDKQCESGYCKCDRSETPWKQVCSSNPLTCISIFGKPEMGCDYIGFFDAPDFGNTPGYIEVNSSDVGWVDITDETAITGIRSYQAYRASKNVKGDYIDKSGNIVASKDLAYKIPCGEAACGCTLSICNDPNPTQSSCINIVDYGLAFNVDVDDSNREVVKIHDETKTTANKIKSGISNLLDFLW